MSECIFCKIVKGEIPLRQDPGGRPSPQLCGHQSHQSGTRAGDPQEALPDAFEMDPEDLQACILAAQKVGKAVVGSLSAEGLNLVQNNYRAAGQLIDHAHFHLIPRHEGDGFLTSWPGSPIRKEVWKSISTRSRGRWK